MSYSRVTFALSVGRWHGLCRYNTIVDKSGEERRWDVAIGETPAVQVGMTVVGSMGGIVGTVEEVQSDDFLVSRTLRRHVYVPLDAVQHVVDTLVALNIPDHQVDHMHWPNP